MVAWAWYSRYAPGQHDDLANVVCGLAVGLTVQYRRVSLVWGRDTRPQRRPGDPKVWIDGPASRLVTRCDLDSFLTAGGQREAGLPLEELYERTAAWMLQRWQLLGAEHT